MGCYGFRRACSQQITIRTPNPPDSYTEMLLVISQDEQNLIVKDMSELETDEYCVIVNLTQEETKRFVAAVPAYLQLRCYSSPYDAPGSAEWPLEVWPALDDRILGGA